MWIDVWNDGQIRRRRVLVFDISPEIRLGHIVAGIPPDNLDFVTAEFSLVGLLVRFDGEFLFVFSV